MELLSPGHLIPLLIVAAILFFGWKQLPDMARSVGRSLRIFKTEMKGMSDDDAARQRAAEPAAAGTEPASPAALPPAAPATPPPAAPVATATPAAPAPPPVASAPPVTPPVTPPPASVPPAPDAPAADPSAPRLRAR